MERTQRPRQRSAPVRILRNATAACASLIALAVLAVPGPPPSAAAADLPFPYVQDFTDADGGTVSGDARIHDGRLRLTEDEHGQAGSWSTRDTFPSDLGLEIEFDWAMYSDDPDAGADGLLMYLADGDAPAGVGGTGAALGYACRPSDTQGWGPCDVPGIPGGFAAVALDRYGNFSLPINDSGPGVVPDAVVVRGSGDGLSGYRHVVGVPAPGRVTTDGPTTRTARVTLVPGDDGELFVTVRLEAGGGMRTVLDDVPLHGDGQTPLPRTLRLGFAAATGAFVDNHEIDRLRVWQPADLRVTHESAPVVDGDRVTYRVTAANVGPNASDPSRFTIEVPSQLEDVTWTCAAAAGSSCADEDGTGDVDTTVGLPRNGAATIEVTGALPDDVTAGDLESTARIATAPPLADVDESDNVSSAATPLVPSPPALATGKSVSPGTVEPGAEVEYTVTARNTGAVPVERVGAVDDLPAPLSFVGSADGCTAVEQRVTCTSDTTLEPGGSHAFRFRAVLDPAYGGDGSDVVNIATATSPTVPDGGDPSPGVGIVVVDRPDEPEPTGTPTAVPTPTDPDPTDTRTSAGDGRGVGGDGDGSAARPRGALAYTGAGGLGLLGALAAGAIGVGAGCWWVRARRRSRPTVD